MKIGIDAAPLSGPHAGVRRAIGEILRELQKSDQENYYCLYSKNDFDFPLQNPRWRRCIHPRIPFMLGSLYLHRGMQHVDGSGDLDVFLLSRPHAFPFGLLPTVARVALVYDLVWILYPETMALRHRVAVSLAAERAIRQAHKIISISESTRQGLVEILATPRDKIEVVPLGVCARFAPRDREQSARFIADKFGVSHDYICTVGTVEPRKNIITLIEAVRILRDRGLLRHQLLIAGESGWKDSNIYASVERGGLTDQQVKFLGRVPDDDLPLLYSGAASFVFPSFYEGFGLPLLEAMASGVPVVASNTSSVPEVVQDAGILVSPRRPDEFADAIDRVTSDSVLSRALTEKGLKRAGKFTWETAALKARHILEKSVQPRRTRATVPPKSR